MRSHHAFVLVIALMFFSSFLSLYTVKAHTVAGRHIWGYSLFPGGRCYWTGIYGSLFPFPQEPSVVTTPGVKIVEVNGVDWFIYRYLIKTWGLAGLSILAWIGTGVFMLTSMTRKSGLNVLS